VAHDSHNLVIAGTDPRDILACARALADSGGGFVAAIDGEVRALLPLPVAGLLSIETADEVCRGLDEVHAVVRALSSGSRRAGRRLQSAVPERMRSAQSFCGSTSP
jgi:adenine deaminase